VPLQGVVFIAQEPPSELGVNWDVRVNNIFFLTRHFQRVFRATVFGEHLRLFYGNDFADAQVRVNAEGKK
jgi:hypothetical protein